MVGRFDFLFRPRLACWLASVLVLAGAKAGPQPAPGLAAVGTGSSALRLGLASAGGFFGGAPGARGGARGPPCLLSPLARFPPRGEGFRGGAGPPRFNLLSGAELHEEG